MPRIPVFALARSARIGLERAGALLYPPAAVLALGLLVVCGVVVPCAPRFDAESAIFAVISALISAVLVLSARFSHPLFRLVTAACFLLATAEPIRDWGLRAYLADVMDPKNMSDPARVVLFALAQVATMGLTDLARAAHGASRRIGRTSAPGSSTAAEG